jgi:predicted dehydrogenase
MKDSRKIFINVGLIGFGNIGKKRLLAIKKIKSVNYKIIYILDKKNKKNNGYFYRSIDDIRSKKVDLLIVCLPTNQTLKVLSKINWNYKWLLLEKPGFENINIFRNFIKRANQKKIHVNIGYNLRFDDGILKARDILKKIGKIYSVKINYSNGTAKSNTNKVGSLLDIGSHSVNLLQYFLNSHNLGRKFKFIQKNEFMYKKKDDNGYVIMKLKNFIIFLHFGFCSWQNTFEFELIGSKGFVKVFSLPKWKDGQKVVYGKRVFPSGKPIIKNFVFKKDNSFKNELEFILKKIKNKMTFNNNLNYSELATFKEIYRIKN